MEVPPKSWKEWLPQLESKCSATFSSEVFRYYRYPFETTNCSFRWYAMHVVIFDSLGSSIQHGAIDDYISGTIFEKSEIKMHIFSACFQRSLVVASRNSLITLCDKVQLWLSWPRDHWCRLWWNSSITNFLTILSFERSIFGLTAATNFTHLQWSDSGNFH